MSPACFDDPALTQRHQRRERTSLARAISALLAGGAPPIDAAAAGVAVHAAAGLLAEQRIGSAGVLASDIARLLPEAITVLRSGSPG